MENHDNNEHREMNEKNANREVILEKFQLDRKKSIFAWALYDWGNSAFATTVMAGFFPLFLNDFWGLGAEIDVTVPLGIGNSIASLIVAILAPILGAIADRMAGKKRFLTFFALLGALTTISLAFLSSGQWQWAIIIYILGTVGFSGANIFYDGLLPGVASEKKIDYVSSLGFSLGYIGGGLLFTLNVIMYLFPSVFGLADANQAVQVSFISVGIWWLIFTIPLLTSVHEPKLEEEVKTGEAIKQGFGQLFDTLKEIRHLKYVVLFLLAFWFYIDGVDTIIRMAVDYGLSLDDIDVTGTDLVIMLLMVQFIAFPGTLLYNWFAQKIGVKNGLFVAIIGYIGITIFGYFISQVWHFYVIGALVGLFQGGIQALSRSVYSRLIPETKSAQFYGFFNMLGKFAAVIGPALMALVLHWTDSTRTSILSIIILFLLGGLFLYLVDLDKGEEMARNHLGRIQ